MTPRVFVVIVVSASFVPVTLAAQGTTVDALTAPRVREQIRVAPAGDQSKTIAFAVDEHRTFETVTAGRTFVASQAVSVTTRNPNPLTTQMTAGIEEADDPSHAAVLKVVDALLSIPDVVKPPAESVKAAVANQRAMIAASQRLELREACDASDKVVALYDALHPDDVTRAALKKALATWRDTIAADPAGVRDALRGSTGVIESARSYAAGIDSEINNAERLIKEMEDTVRSTAAPANECEQLRRGLYAASLLSDPHSRVAELAHVRDSVNDVMNALTEFADQKHWLGASNDYVLTTVNPSVSKMQKVTVRFVRLEYGAADDRSGIVVKSTDAGAGAFTVRNFDRFVAETAVGIIRSNLKKPSYGTTTNAARQTIAVKVGDDDIAWDAAVMGNFVCRCGWGSTLAPMLQIGALASKETPAVLVGGGLRLFGLPKGSVGIGGGVAFGWVKQLPDDKVGAVVTGTKDIEANLRFENKQSPYFTLQYSF